MIDAPTLADAKALLETDPYKWHGNSDGAKSYTPPESERAALVDEVMTNLYILLERDFGDYPLIELMSVEQPIGKPKRIAVPPDKSCAFFSALRKVLRREGWNQPLHDCMGEIDSLRKKINKSQDVIRALLDVVQKQHEALKDVVESVAITESMGEICQKDDFRDTRTAIAIGQPWIENSVDQKEG
jgi:hypothetical protein